MLRRYELIEIYTDSKGEEPYAAYQREVTGLNANPTYIVLDSENKLEVARMAYTVDKQEYLAFLRQGLSNEPQFRSFLEFDGLALVEKVKDADGNVVLDDEGKPKNERVVVLETTGRVEADEGVKVGEDDLDRPLLAYQGAFRGEQEFRVGRNLEPGEYVIRATLVAGVYERDDRTLRGIESRTVRLSFTVTTPSP